MNTIIGKTSKKAAAGHQYAAIAFTPQVKQMQLEQNSRSNYQSMEEGEQFNNVLSLRENSFISERDSFYMASVGETGWPYVQHRGGPAGFMRVIDEHTIGFADFSGNLQYISAGNFRTNDRVSLIFMDYPNRRRLKVLGRISLVASDDWEMLAQLELNQYQAWVERGFTIKIEAFDWNCPQHITPRYTDDDIEKLLAPLIEENRALKNAKEIPVVDTTLPSLINTQSLGDGSQALQISGVRQLTPHVRAYELRDVNGAELPVVSAGAHLQVPVITKGGEHQIRHYSICSDPDQQEYYEIAVMNDDEGTGGSTFIHKNYQVGKILYCESPANYFELAQESRPITLIAGGIGITPIKSMAYTLKKAAANFNVHYAGRSQKEMPFYHTLQQQLGDRIHLYRSEVKERMNIAEIMAGATDDAIFYICGPNRLIDAVIKEANRQNIAPDRIRFERFSATMTPQDTAFGITLKRSNLTLQVETNKTVLDTLLDAGVSIPFSCKTGNCRSCVTSVLDGTVEHRDSSLTDVERNDGKLICPCVSRASSQSLTLDI